MRSSFILLGALLAASLAGPAQAQTGFDRRGGDYLNFQIRNGDPAVCAARCERDARCRAWSFSYPRTATVIATCWLKNKVPPRQEDKCCVSGVRGAGVIEPRNGADRIFHRPLRRRLPQFRHRRPTPKARPARRPARPRTAAAPGPMCGPAIISVTRALLSQGQAQAAAAQAVLHFGRGALAASPAQCTALKNRDSRKPEGQVQIGWLFMPRSQEPTIPSTRPTRLSTGNMPTPPGAQRHAAVGGIVAVVAHDEQMTGRHDGLRHVVERIERRQLEDQVLALARQRLDEARGRHVRAVLVFGLAGAVGSNADRRCR